jgi:hypothetical protein
MDNPDSRMILPVSWITDAALFVFGAAVGSF